MPPVTQEEARKALADIDQVARHVKRALAGTPMSTGLLTGGIMWMVGFTLNFLFPAHASLVWSAVSSLGLSFMALAISRAHRRGQVLSAEATYLLRQIALFWVAVLGYLLAVCLMLPNIHWADQLLLIVAFLMLAYVLMGIWLRTPLLSGIGLAVTAAAWAGRLFLPPRYFLLWMAALGGGGLFVPGLYVKLRWK